jgi:hypothetical protein
VALRIAGDVFAERISKPRMPHWESDKLAAGTTIVFIVERKTISGRVGTLISGSSLGR